MLYNIFLIMLVAGVALFIASLVLLFVFHVPDLIDELTGNRARRQIKRLKELNSGTNTLDSVATNEVYKSLSTGALRVEDTEPEEDDDVIIKEVSREIDTGSLAEKEQEVISTKDWDAEEQETGYINQKLSTVSEDKITQEESEEATGYMGDTELATGYIAVDEPPTGYMQEFEEATGFMQIAPDEEEATGVLSDVKDFVSRRQFVEIIEEQTSLNLSAIL